MKPQQTSVGGAQTLTNGLTVLRAIADGARTIGDIQAATGLGRSTAHRLVQALRADRFARQSESGLSLGPALIELGARALQENTLAAVARPVLSRLAAEARDTVHLAVVDDGSVLYLVKIPGTRGAEMRSRVGHRMPLTSTGVGKALLIDETNGWREAWASDHAPSSRAEDEVAFEQLMNDYRRKGFALDLEENEPGIRCVAAPVRGADGGIIGAVSVAATLPYMPEGRLFELAPTVVAAATEISHEMGYRNWRRPIQPPTP